MGETLVTHAERVTGGKRSCEGAAVTACTVAAERWMKGGRSTLWGKHETCKVCGHATRTCSQITCHMTETLPGFMEGLFFRKGEGVEAFTAGEEKEEERCCEQKEKVEEEIGHLQLLKRDKPLKCLSVN